MDKQEIQDSCQEIFDEIIYLRECLKWSNHQIFCEKVFVEINDNDTTFDEGEEKETKKFTEKVKKIFQRKSWEKGTARKATLAELESIRNAIFCCEDYQKSKLYGNSLSLKTRQAIKRASKKLEKRLLKEDYES